MTLDGLSNLMDSLAVDTWSAIEDVYVLGVDYGEVTATHVNLRAIRKFAVATGFPLEVKRVTSREERRVGADWEFWLVLKSGAALGYSIQAKRVYERDGRYHYSELGHRGERPGEKQYDTLIRHAKAHGSHPVHVLYNGWPLPNAWFRFPTKPQQFYGCAAISTHQLRSVRVRNGRRGVNDAAHYAPYSFPWSDLFRLDPVAPDDGESHKGGGPDGAATDPTKPRGPDGPGDSIVPPRPNFTREDLEELSARASRRAGLLTPLPLADGLPKYVLEPDFGYSERSDHGVTDLPEFAVVMYER